MQEFRKFFTEDPANESVFKWLLSMSTLMTYKEARHDHTFAQVSKDRV